VQRSGAHVAGIGVVIELAFLKGFADLSKYECFSLVKYDSE
jgi:adenine/guanine phosphoribosyltransferase-like PRPP-binding protein